MRKKRSLPQMPKTLSAELEKVAKENCHETAEIRETSLATIRQWLKKTPHLKARTNDDLLLAFLRYCRFNLEHTKQRLDSFYSLKMVFPEVLMNRLLDESLLALYRQGIHTIPLDPVSADGPRVVISQFSKYDPKTVGPKEIFKLLFMLLEMLANEDANASVAGIVYIADARDVTMQQMLQYDPVMLKKTWTLIEQCFPIRFNEIHVINMRKDGRALFNFVTSFLPHHITIKFMVHQKAEDLYEHICRDAMTVEYGGHNGYQVEALNHWESIMLKYRDYFASDDNYGSNEKLRVGLSTARVEVSQLIGLNGSFRKLQID